MRTFEKVFLWAPILLILGAGAANADDAMQTKAAGAYRVELHVLPAEPFFSKQDVISKNVQEGMEIEGGAAPVALGADSHPNHHLVVHVFGKDTGKVVADAVVTMNFASLASAGKPTGAPVEVPVVVMQAIGKGPASTHYGNNVTMPAGHYSVAVTVNGQKAVFDVTASDARSGSMGGMNMGGMKM